MTNTPHPGPEAAPAGPPVASAGPPVASAAPSAPATLLPRTTPRTSPPHAAPRAPHPHTTRRPPRPHPRTTRRPATLRPAALLLALLCLLAAACGKEGSPPAKGPSAAELPRYRVASGFRLPDSPTWRKAKARGRLVVGAKEDQPYLGEKDPASGKYTGFDIEIAKMVAAGLGFPANRISFRTIASANRETSLQNGQIDYYVGTYTINDNRKKLVGFAGPYYMAGQGLLVRKDEDGIKGPADLDGKRVCSAAGSTPYQRIQHDYPKAELVSYDTYSICVDNLLTYQVDAVTTDDSILLGYAAKVPEELKVVGKSFSKEPYGIGVPRKDNALRLAIDGILAARERDGTWKKAYQATLGLSGVPAPKPPPIDRYPAS